MDDDKMSTNKISGLVSFHMKLTQGLDVTETKFDTSATLYKKNEKFFLFFNETNFEDDSITKCRYEMDDNSVRIRRDGPIIMDQIYKISALQSGYIKTIYGQLDTKSKTHRLSLEILDATLTLNLDYDLFVSNERAGNYKLTGIFNKEDI